MSLLTALGTSARLACRGVRVEAWLTRAAAARARSRSRSRLRSAQLTYRELDRARRRRGPRARRGARHAGRDRAAAGARFRGCAPRMLAAGAIAVPLDLRDPTRERRAADADPVMEAPLRVPGPPLAAIPATSSRPPPSSSTPPARAGAEGGPADATGTSSGAPSARPSHSGVDPGERWLCTLPLVHVGGLSIVLRSAIYGTTAVLHERFETEAALGALRGGAITLVSVVATTLTRLLDAGLREPPALRCALAGGGPVPPALIERARVAGDPREPDLRAHRGVLAGRDAGARATGGRARARRFLHTRRARARRRDPGQRPDRESGRRAACSPPAISARCWTTARCA